MKTEDPRITAIREKIEAECKGYTMYQQKKQARLTRTLEHLLSHPGSQFFLDHSQGGTEVYRGLDAIERLMAEEIRSADNPIR